MDANLDTPAGAGRRIDAIDLLRGLVIVLMVLDHTRDFFNIGTIRAEDLGKASLGLFFTRWITHFCAPTFVLLAGVSAAIFARARPAEATRFLLERGLLLILLDLVVVNLSWPLIYGLQVIFVQVLWVLGASMVLLALLHRAPRALLLALSLLLIFGHNLLDGVKAAELGSFGPLWNLLHEDGIQPLGGGFLFLVIYPLIPWPGVMILGFLLGDLYRDLSPEGAARRARFLYAAGAGALLLFVALRFSNLYGDPNPWRPNERGPAFTLAEFLNTEKYPPSLLFLLMTLGPALLALPLLERWRGRLADFFLDFGRVPLFFYLIHVPVLHLASLAWSHLFHGGVNLIVDDPPAWPASYHPSLLRNYLVWLAVVIALRPACRAFLAWKRRSTGRWVRYF